MANAITDGDMLPETDDNAKITEVCTHNLYQQPINVLPKTFQEASLAVP